MNVILPTGSKVIVLVCVVVSFTTCFAHSLEIFIIFVLMPTVGAVSGKKEKSLQIVNNFLTFFCKIQPY